MQIAIALSLITLSWNSGTFDLDQRYRGYNHQLDLAW